MVQSVQKESAPLASNALSPSTASAKFSNMGMGIEEDSATGAACAGLVGAMASKQDFGGTAYRLSIQQGISMGRPSEIEAEARKSVSVVTSVSVSVAVAYVASGEIEVPPSALVSQIVEGAPMRVSRCQ